MQKKITVQIINKSTNELPAYATEGSSGLDIRANITESIELQPLERILVPTGLYISIPQGYEIQVRPRSGLALKNGLTCLNSPGTIDSDYRGELKVLLINLSNQSQKIVNGDRIAQLVLQKVESLEWQKVNELNSTLRNEGGFGHSGVQ
jgi:dUTP pyrophosphatase